MQTGTSHQTPAGYTLEVVSEHDIPDVVDYINESDRLEPKEEGITLGEFTEWFHSPFNQGILMAARLRDDSARQDTGGGQSATPGHGKVIGFMEFSPRGEYASGSLHVHPNYRHAGVGRALYAEFERRAKEAGAASMRIGANREAGLLIGFLERRGFALERYFWSMRLPAEAEVDRPALPEGMSVRTFVPGQDEQLWTDVRNATFAEHYGSVPRTVEEMTQLSRQEHFRPEGLFFAFEGEQIAGFCATGIDPREAERLGIDIGHIHTLGVMPAYRGQGIGRGLLLEGINYLRKYVSVIDLGVEGKNDRALALYEGVGFHVHKGWANMVKGL